MALLAAMVPADFVIPELRHLMTCSNLSSQPGISHVSLSA